MSVGTTGKHIILDLWGVTPKKLRSLSFVQNALLKARESSKATLIGKKFHKFMPEGVSGYILIAESHISIHTWPEEGYASVDIYTCGDKVFPIKAAEYLISAFEPEHHDTFKLDRGDKGNRKIQIDAR